METAEAVRTRECLDVLLVEDSPRDVFVMREIVAASRHCDFRLTHAGSLAAALEQLRNLRFDLILLDLTLPDSSGLTTFDRMRLAARSTPLILMTAVSDEETALQAVRGGAQDYLVKGDLSPALVLRAMRHAVERRRVEDELRRNRDRFERLQLRYHSILRATPNGVCLISPNWRITFCNRAMGQLLDPGDDTRTSDLVGHDLAAYFPTRERFESYLRQARRAIQTGGADQREVELRRADGSTLWCELCLTRVDPTESAPGYVLTATDISERRRSQLEREVLSWLGIQIATVGTLEELGEETSRAVEELWDCDSFALAVSTGARFETITRVAGCAGKRRHLPPVSFQLAEDSREAASLREGICLMYRAGEGVTPPSIPLDWIGGGNGCILLAPLRAGSGTLGLLAIVSSRIGTFSVEERGLLQRVADLIAPAVERCRREAERARLAAAVEQSSEAVSIADSDWVVRYVNPAFERITGYRREEVVGERMRSVLSSSDYDSLFHAAIEPALERGQTWNGRLTGKRKDGTAYVEELTISPVRDGAGRTTQYLSIRRDVSRETELEGELRQSQKMEAVGMLAGGIAHDFNNILQIIVGQGQILLMHMASDAPMREELERIVSAGKRGASLTRQLLVFSRRQQLEPQILDLNTVVSGLEKILGRTLGEDIELVMQTDPEPCLVSADPGQLEQVLLNLAINARDAMPDGGILRISTDREVIGAERDSSSSRLPAGDYVALTVSDTGCGMPPEVRERIFEPFFTTKEVGRGTGLGLSTVYGIVKQSEGEIAVRSAIGQGTTFTVLLPRVRALVPTGDGREESSPMPSWNECTATVLLVEDEPDVRMLIRMLLTGRGYRVLEAGNGSEGLLIGQQYEGSIQLLLTDVVMPGLSGPELARQLAQSRPGLRVLFMSGYTDRALNVHGIDEMGAPLLQKPFGPEILFAKLREVLAESPMADVSP